MTRPLAALLVTAAALVLATACGGETPDPDPVAAGSSGSAGSGDAGTAGTAGTAGSGGSAGTAGAAGTAGSGGSAGTGGTTAVREPKVHRAEAVACDGVRATLDPNILAGQEALASCQQNEDCTEGVNGRCTGNGHDGWQCTYDLCTTDSDCGNGKVCSCEGGFRTDNDVCIATTCNVDADCGDNFCSPSLGDCGHFDKFVTYACHTPEDECIDDEDCTAGSEALPATCRFQQSVGHWKCSTAECVG
jgi:hypothetical protein